MTTSLKQKLQNINIKMDFHADDLVVFSTNNGLLFELIIDEPTDDNLKEALTNELTHHLECIETEDERYFDDCDAEYLKGEWKQLLLKISDTIKTEDTK
jgi:hypothetical protein